MWPLLPISIFLLIQQHAAEGFAVLPDPRQVADTAFLEKRPILASTLDDYDASLSQRDRCLERVREFEAEIDDILQSIRIVEERIHREQQQQQEVSASEEQQPPPPPLPPPPSPPASVDPLSSSMMNNNGATTPTIIADDEGIIMPKSTSSLLAGIAFQLEEMEDRDGCSTEIILENDNTITVGRTDGPLFAYATGNWLVSPHDNRIDMVITRHYDAGQKARSYTDLGEFSFPVTRTYQGQLTNIGDQLAIMGTIHCSLSDEISSSSTDDNNDDIEVGFFNMIDSRVADDGESFMEAGISRFPGRSRVS